MSINLKNLLLIIILFTLVNCNKEIKDRDQHSLPVVYLNASDTELFSDSIGIYVEGIGNAVNWQGMAANYFSGDKITAQFRYFEKGEFVVNKTVDIKVSGGGSRKLPQKSFNIYSEEKYGEKYFFYPFFKNRAYQKFSALRLRNSGQDWEKTHMRDALMHTLIEDLNVYNQAYQPVVLYLNDKYWGIYNLREKFNKTYIRNKQGLSEQSTFDIIERRWNVEEGDSTKYMEMIRFLESNSLESSTSYQEIEKLIDIPHYIDYVCAQIYFGNTDWPGNNIKFWKSREDKAKWSWFIHDTDLGFAFAPIFGHPGGTVHNTFVFNLNKEEPGVIHNQPWATFLFRCFMKNPSFRNQFYDRMQYLLQNEFNSIAVLNTIDSLADILRPEMNDHINRWKEENENLYQSLPEWEANIEELREFARFRPEIIQDYISTYYIQQNWK